MQWYQDKDWGLQQQVTTPEFPFIPCDMHKVFYEVLGMGSNEDCASSSYNED